MNSHSENDIARVLTGLRDTQPSAGLEQRILHGIQQRTPARTPLFMRWQLIAAVPATALAIFLAAHFLAPQHTEPAVATASTPTTAAGGPSFAPFAKGGVSSNARPLSSTPSTTLASRPEDAYFSAAVERPAAPPPVGAQLSAADRQALEDTNAPSQPSPALPLSRDERILLAAAQREGSVEVAQLDATENPLRAATSAREGNAVKAAVQSLLRQLAAAEALNPTPPAPEASDPHPPADSAALDTESAPDSQ
jgi:hypothetical protein